MTDQVLQNWSDEQLLNYLVKGKPTTMAETATDMGKSAIRGTEDFAIGTAGLPGDVLGLAEAGASKIAGPKYQEFKGRTNPQLSVPGSPAIQKAVEQWTGPLYEPQTGAGKMTRSVFSMAPAALPGPIAQLPGRMARMALAPGLASEYVGSKLEGSPWEIPGRVAASLAAPTALGRVVNPLPINAQRREAVDLLRDEGVPLTAGQITGRRSLQAAESALGSLPFAGKRLADVTEGQKGKFVEAALARILPKEDEDWIRAVRGSRGGLAGVPDEEILAMRNQSESKLATPETLDVGRTYGAQKLEDAAGGTVLKFTPDIENKILDWKQRWLQAGLPADDEKRLDALARQYVRAHVTGKAGEAPQLKGEAYQGLTNYTSNLSSSAREGSSDVKRYSKELRDIIEGERERAAFERGTSTGSQPRRNSYFDMNEGRRAYKDFLAIEDAAGKGVGGTFTPTNLKVALQGQDRQGYNRGRGDMRDLAEAGKEVMVSYPDSGTAGRLYAMSLPVSAATAIGGYYSDPSVTNATGATGLAGMVVPPLMGRAVMSRPAQWWLSNFGRGSGVRNAVGAPSERERVARLLALEQATYPAREQKGLPYEPPLALPSP